MPVKKIVFFSSMLICVHFILVFTLKLRTQNYLIDLNDEIRNFTYLL